MVHTLKTLPEYFSAVLDGSKPFEVRKNDRGFKVGDALVLREYAPHFGYTGREYVVKVTYILDNAEYCKEGYVILGLNV